MYIMFELLLVTCTLVVMEFFSLNIALLELFYGVPTTVTESK